MSADELFEEATLNWRDNRGVGTAFVPAPLNDKVLVYKVLSKMYARSPTMTTVIVVNDFGERNQIIEFLTHQNDEENDGKKACTPAMCRSDAGKPAGDGNGSGCHSGGNCCDPGACVQVPDWGFCGQHVFVPEQCEILEAGGAARWWRRRWFCLLRF